MDDRQTQIKEGAGLEESRINKEFIDFLNKWSSPVITVLAVAALVWAGLGYLERRKLERVDEAIAAYEAAVQGGNPSPASLTALASEYDDVRAIPDLAQLRTVDLYLSAYLRGVEPGVEIDPATGRPVDGGATLDEDQRQRYLGQARSIADEVIARLEGNTDKAILSIQALIRRGAIAECERDLDKARSSYERAKATAESAQLDALAIFAQTRIDAIDTLDPDLVLPSSDDLQTLPGESLPEIPTTPDVIPTEGLDDSVFPSDETDTPSEDPLDTIENEPAPTEGSDSP